MSRAARSTANRMPGQPMRAQVIAVLLVGSSAAKGLKKRWDHRQSFYPAPMQAGAHGQAHLYDAAEVITAAARAGDISAEQIEAAFRALQCIAVRRCRSAR